MLGRRSKKRLQYSLRATGWVNDEYLDDVNFETPLSDLNLRIVCCTLVQDGDEGVVPLTKDRTEVLLDGFWVLLLHRVKHIDCTPED